MRFLLRAVAVLVLDLLKLHSMLVEHDALVVDVDANTSVE